MPVQAPYGAGGGGPLASTSRSDWAQLLEQASDFNDELCRENCELHREVSVLRERRRQQQLQQQRQQGSSGGAVSNSRAERAAFLLPRVMSRVRRALRNTAGPAPPGAEGLPGVVEEAIRRVLVRAADLGRGEAALASSEETAALVSEKVALKEFSMRQQERLLELELAREKLSGSTQGHWASRLTSALGTLAENAVAAQAAATGVPDAKAATAAPVPEKATGPMVAVGEECEVVGRKGAILRETEDMESEKVATLPPGARVRVLELAGAGGRRAKVQAILPAGSTPTADAAAPAAADAAAPAAGGGGGEPDASAANVVVGGAAGGVAPEAAAGGAAPEGAAGGSSEGAELGGEGTEAAPPPPAGEDGSEGPQITTDVAAEPPSEAAGSGQEAALPPALEGEPPPPEVVEDNAPASDVVLGAIGWLSIVTKDGKALIRPIIAAVEEPTQEVRRDSDPQPAQLVGDPGTGDNQAPQRELSVEDAATGEVLLNQRPAAVASGTVTVSTDAWLALRNERNQREKQIKALQAQVDAAQEEIRQLAEVRAQLREQRALALEARRRGNELHEAARMAAEELLAIRVAEERIRQEGEAEGQLAVVHSDDTEASVEDAAEGVPDAGAEEVPADTLGDCPTEAAPEQAAGTGGGPSSIEWQRLLSERETTAQELSHTLRRVEELETELEERRIELQIAERRRERERRGLLTALRELRAQRGGGGGDAGGGEEEDGEEGEEDAAEGGAAGGNTAPGASSPGRSPGRPDRERRYLQKISELEEVASRLRAQLDEVQAREAALNRSAVTRGAALRYATAAVAGSCRGSVYEADAPQLLDFSPPGGGDGLPVRTGRADLDGLAEMLDRLFVENFALRGGGRGGAGPPPVAPPPSCGSAGASFAGFGGMPAGPLDLSRFVVDGGTASEDDEEAERPGEVATATRSAPRGPTPVLPLTPLQRGQGGLGLDGTTAAAPREPPASPRSRLLRGLDFSSLSVVE